MLPEIQSSLFFSQLKTFVPPVVSKHLTGIMLSPYIYGQLTLYNHNFPPIASVAKPLVELVTPSPWLGGPEFKPQLQLIMPSIIGMYHGFNLWHGEMY